MNSITNCRICNCPDLINIIDLGSQVITSRFPPFGDFTTPSVPLQLCICEDCYLLQLRDTTNNDELYKQEYGYRSGINNTMREHLKQYNDEIQQHVKLSEGDIVLDIGSNDATMLKYYPQNVRRIGIDPTGEQFKEYYTDGVEIIPDYFSRVVVSGAIDKKIKVISSISMFYDLPDPVQFAQDVYDLLDDDGIWTCEQSYLLFMLQRNSIDTICHEHLEYYALYQIREIARIVGFIIIDVKFNECNGGSFRVYMAKRTSLRFYENVALVESIIKDEIDYGIMNMNTYVKFMYNCDREINYLTEFIDIVNENNKLIYIYGASTKGNCLLQYAEIDNTQIPLAVERNPNKVGKMTSTGIRIISEEEMRNAPPDYLLVLPWHFRNEIIAREREFLERGGQLIFPFPHFEIYSEKKKVLITGCDGFIGEYVKRRFSGESLYGIMRSPISRESSTITTPRSPRLTRSPRKPWFPWNKRASETSDPILREEFIENPVSIVKIPMDLNNDYCLNSILLSLKPDIIIHLASISSSNYALRNPIETLYINGLVAAKLCDIVKRTGLQTRIFHASSSEIYKGHNTYTVHEDDTNLFHTHPYSIAKITGSSMVKFYREKYNIFACNGVLFTVESSKKRPEFLLNKVAEHIRTWKNGIQTVLKLGNLDSYRSIIHPVDVADAIYRIMMTDGDKAVAQDYLICGNESVKVSTMVERIFEFAQMEVVFRENAYYLKETNEQIIEISAAEGNESQPTNISGECKKLYDLGWKITHTTDDILKEIEHGCH